jgi:hypothetical protein
MAKRQGGTLVRCHCYLRLARGRNASGSELLDQFLPLFSLLMIVRERLIDHDVLLKLKFRQHRQPRSALPLHENEIFPSVGIADETYYNFHRPQVIPTEVKISSVIPLLANENYVT